MRPDGRLLARLSQRMSAELDAARAEIAKLRGSLWRTHDEIAPDRAAAVQIAQKALNERRGFGNVQAGYAEAVVAALDRAKLLRRPDEAAYVAALEAVAEAAREHDAAIGQWAGVALSPEVARTWIALENALDAVPAAETGSREVCDCQRNELGMATENSGHCAVHPLPGCPNPAVPDAETSGGNTLVCPDCREVDPDGDCRDR